MSSKKTTIDNEFPSRLRQFIADDLRISQREFAKNIGITAGYLSMVLTKKRGPSAELIAGIFLNYREHLEWLLTGSSKPETLMSPESVRFENLERRLSDLESMSHTHDGHVIKRGGSTQE